MAIPSSQYRERLIDRALDEHAGELPALLVVGHRACGKSTTLIQREATCLPLVASGACRSWLVEPVDRG